MLQKALIIVVLLLNNHLENNEILCKRIKTTEFQYSRSFGQPFEANHHKKDEIAADDPMEKVEIESDDDDVTRGSIENKEEEKEKPQYSELYLDNSHAIHLLWDVDYQREQIVVEVRANTWRNQWLAIGFSDYGELTRADFCVLWWDNWSKAHFHDSWSDSKGQLHVDQQQDCQLLRLLQTDQGVIFMFQRQFDTCDEHDFLLDDGTIHIVYATDKGPINKVTEIQVLQSQHGFQRAQMLKPQRPPVTFPKDTKIFSVLAKQFEAVIQPGHETLVHHMEVFHCETPKGSQLPYYDGPCAGPERPPELEPCRKVIAAWAMGAPPLTYPKDAGLPIGGPGFSEYVVLEIHYNNEELRDDFVDSSGVRFHYTSNLRRHDAGVIEVGLEYTPKMAIPPHMPSFILSGHCIIECTQVGLPPTGIVLFAAQLHTHLTGKQVVVRHYRGGIEMAEVARDDHYSPHFQEIRHLRRTKLVLPGDALVTSCTYNTMDRENITLGGFAIRDEMCVSYIHYYPKSELEVCKSSIDSDVLDDYFQFLNDFEEQETSAEKPVPENYRSVQWNPLRSQMLHMLYDAAPLSMQCNKSSGDRFPGFWNNSPQTKVLWPLPAKPRVCNESKEMQPENGEDEIESSM